MNKRLVLEKKDGLKFEARNWEDKQFIQPIVSDTSQQKWINNIGDTNLDEGRDWKQQTAWFIKEMRKHGGFTSKDRGFLKSGYLLPFSTGFPMNTSSMLDDVEAHPLDPTASLTWVSMDHPGMEASTAASRLDES